MTADSEQSAQDACPVDHKTRAVWMESARKQSSSQQQQQQQQTKAVASSTQTVLGGDSCDSSTIDQTSPSKPQPSTSTSSLPIPKSLRPRPTPPLGADRETSTIPRVSQTPSPSTPGAERTSFANNEQETGASTSGKWIYPSEQMFFDAMKRKKYDPKTEDMHSIVPIHNAVNERAWAEIKSWEKGRGAERCGGPRLQSFSGTATALTPRARWNTLLGYHAPFDRHDWVVDRCGTRVDYVIDFYSGKDEGTGKSLNFFLDVRPKLNTWEGWKMRGWRFVGLY